MQQVAPAVNHGGNVRRRRGTGLAPGLAIECTDLVLRYPLVDRANAWRLLFGDIERFDAVTALDDVSLEVAEGRFLGVLGVNGSGKSTLLRVVGGVYSPTRGRVLVSGMISGLFELGGFGNRNITGIEYARRYLQLYGAASTELPALLADIVGFSELGEKFDDPIYTYSSGMAARLFFATATALRYDVYLIDEALSVGDEHFQAKCWSRLRDRFADGASGIFVTHDWTSVLKLCETALILEHGKLLEAGPAQTVVRSYIGFEKPDPGCARIECPDAYQAHSGEDVRLPFTIVCDDDASCIFHMSVEAFNRGMGWEVVLVANDFEACSGPGRFDFEIAVDQLPLVPGRYSLNFFLTVRRTGETGTPALSDARGWTYGNGLELHVTGDADEGTVALPNRWEISLGTHGTIDLN